jgi:predicted dehydrogenase
MNKSRRKFMQNVATAGAALTAASALLPRKASAVESAATAPEAPTDWGKLPVIRAALIGAGSQGRNLMNNYFRTENAVVHFVAVCDIWEYQSRYASKLITTTYKSALPQYDRYKATKPDMNVRTYIDCAEMIDKEAKNLDVAIVASPDWMHAPHTNMCLKAGIHVYCEKEMANTLEAAKSMVLTARETGKLLQIGHQRRSNPRYLHAKNLVQKERLCGRITNMMGQWNRSVKEPIPWPKDKNGCPTEILEKYGYKTMERLTNWRWFHQYSGGAIADLGSHQIDIFNWFLDSFPIAVQASGGLDYYDKSVREWYDNILCLLEYNTAPAAAIPEVKDAAGKVISSEIPASPGGPARAFYQVINTSGFGGYYEVFMGTGGTLDISEDPKHGALAREPGVAKRVWENDADMIEAPGGLQKMQLKLGESLSAPGSKPKFDRLATENAKPPHQLHIENFLEAVIKKNGKILNCPPEVGYETAVSVLKINDAVKSGQKIFYKPEEFKV